MSLDEEQTKKLEAFLSEVDDDVLANSLDRELEEVKKRYVTPHEVVRKKNEKWL